MPTHRLFSVTMSLRLVDRELEQEAELEAEAEADSIGNVVLLLRSHSTRKARSSSRARGL